MSNDRWSRKVCFSWTPQYTTSYVGVCAQSHLFFIQKMTELYYCFAKGNHTPVTYLTYLSNRICNLFHFHHFVCNILSFYGKFQKYNHLPPSDMVQTIHIKYICNLNWWPWNHPGCFLQYQIALKLNQVHCMSCDILYGRKFRSFFWCTFQKILLK